MRQRRDQARVHVHLRQPRRPPGGVVLGEARRLLGGIGQLVVAVGQLQPLEIELEARGHPRPVLGVAVAPGQGRLARRIVHHHLDALAAKPRLDHEAHQQVEAVIPGGVLHGQPAPLLGQAAQLRQRRGKGVDGQRLAKQRPVAAPAQWRRLIPRGSAQHSAHQGGGLLDQRVEGEAGAVPLQHGELEVVAPPHLAVAKAVRQLEDGARAGRQQPLHGELRRGLQPEPLAPGGGDGLGRERRQVQVGAAAVAQHRRLHLQHAALGEEGPHLGQQPRPVAQGRDRRRGAPVVDHSLPS